MRINGALILLSLVAFSQAATIDRRQQGKGNANKGGAGGGGAAAAAAAKNNGAAAASAAAAKNNGAAAASAAAAKNNGGAAASAAAAAKDNGGTATCLNANAVQTASNKDGQDVPADGQASSDTDAANFINFCAGETLTNGLQTKGGSCNGVVMGKIPSTANMVSSIIVSPQPAENLAAGKTFDVQVQTSGLAAGSFTNAASTYYSAPQDLNGAGQIIGHTHVTIQDMGKSLTPTTALDATKFAFFKGINDAGNNKGLLSATVTGGLPAGNYRVCTMSSSSNHQPVLMPVAQRGAQDDCTKFTVGAAAANANANAGAANANANAGAANAGKANAGAANANGGKGAGKGQR